MTTNRDHREEEDESTDPKQLLSRKQRRAIETKLNALRRKGKMKPEQ
jgi:hypothetical protein